ncbi:hypothetical protein HNR23_000852 [Nocardiopsis mwathae]|uniref:Uncharacterized protein n=1 Tax=Nocardiopsis mwathae TaxID=1472723 RepID=A0A7X0D408_9ACTN|nr:ABC transporter permease [Nocardiopsis mwathae]MBB6170792.1 hypothetical protein [Nocardiopsis mwathae]
MIPLRLHRACWPLPPLLLALPSLAITLLTAYATADQLSLTAPDWTHTSGLIADGMRLPTVVAAAAAGLIACRLTPRTRIFAQTWQSRTGWPSVWRQAVPALGWFLGAYLLGLVPLLWRTAQGAGHGGPDLLVVGGVLVEFAAVVALGYLVGAAIANPLAVPAAAGVALLTLYLPGALGAWSGFTPAVVADRPYLGMREERPFAAFRLGMSAFVLIVAAVLADRLMRGGRSWSAASYGPAAVLLAVAVALIPPYPAWGWVEYAPDKPQLCQDDPAVRVCVHQGHAAYLTDTTKRAAALVGAYGAEAVDFTEIRDLSLARSHADVLVGEREGVLWLRIRPGWDAERDVAATLTRRLVPDTAVACGSEGVARLDPEAEPEQRRAAVLVELGAWLEGDASGGAEGGPSEDSLFGAASEDEVRAWIGEARGSIAACQVDPEDLPWRL